MDPTYQGFVLWVQQIMAVPQASMPSAIWLQTAYAESLNLTYVGLACVPSVSGNIFPYVEQPINPPNPPPPPFTPPSIYATAVYNLGGAILVDIAQDTPPSTYWSDLRNSMNINGFQPGIINSAADQGTSETTFVPDSLKGLTLFDLQLLKTPWGRAYLAIAGLWGALWGIT
jgi:hypothetical protein